MFFKSAATRGNFFFDQHGGEGIIGPVLIPKIKKALKMFWNVLSPYCFKVAVS